MKCRTIFASCGKEYPIYLGSKLHHLIDFKKNKLVSKTINNKNQVSRIHIVKKTGGSLFKNFIQFM